MRFPGLRGPEVVFGSPESQVLAPAHSTSYTTLNMGICTNWSKWLCYPPSVLGGPTIPPHAQERGGVARVPPSPPGRSIPARLGTRARPHRHHPSPQEEQLETQRLRVVVRLRTASGGSAAVRLRDRERPLERAAAS